MGRGAKVTVRKSSRALDDGVADFGRCFLQQRHRPLRSCSSACQLVAFAVILWLCLAVFAWIRKGEVIHCASLPRFFFERGRADCGRRFFFERGRAEWTAFFLHHFIIVNTISVAVLRIRVCTSFSTVGSTARRLASFPAIGPAHPSRNCKFDCSCLPTVYIAHHLLCQFDCLNRSS